MAKFNPADYETVEDRLKVFWKDNPEGRIETEILHITPEGNCVTIQASVEHWLIGSTKVVIRSDQVQKRCQRWVILNLK